MRASLTAQAPNTPPELLQFSGYIISNAGIARWGSRLTDPPHTFPPDAAIVASEQVCKRLKATNLAGLLNVGTTQHPRFIIFTKNQVLPYRETIHENDLAPLIADKWDRWTLKMLVQEHQVDPSEITGFKSVLPNNVPHDPDMFGDMSKTDMEEWWREAP
ncbi:hypothetical protein AGABI1DRAFT_131258 [Agaricus bisporus var. burnettii JB137-S8]|uniref:Uncharacterized protein n=1 Tax=Agaricus bisporus var. burnettii (strain JB137-S8 / ATCC MYA-4627 / FGSC 10392) TaxID=597362 RepID=K5WM81_AGABU|nr:uncharacterized protein AGABI1DRAFT_131258 [Agaricus bisporus var. burnettii JB137-S8]EKM76431.1 hypothetical protein AGABI1DRAFT_131258 [Agaricus bisporus var. burnettii JB137-S8]